MCMITVKEDYEHVSEKIDPAFPEPMGEPIATSPKYKAYPIIKIKVSPVSASS